MNIVHIQLIGIVLVTRETGHYSNETGSLSSTNVAFSVLFLSVNYLIMRRFTRMLLSFRFAIRKYRSHHFSGKMNTFYGVGLPRLLY